MDVTRTERPDSATPATGVRLAAITPDNVGAACKVAVRPDQERHVAPVAWSLAEA